MRHRAAILTAILALCSCADGRADPPGEQAGERDRAVVVRAVIDVADVGASVERVRRVVAQNDGYVRSATTSDRARVVARVPRARLDGFRAELRELGDVQSESEEVEDVTEQRADQGARLRSARVEEERLLALMSDRAATLADVIAIEERLASVRERIEQLEAEERALTQRVELAEVQIELTPRRAPFWHDPVATIARAGSFGLDAAGAIVVGGAALAAGAGPTLLMVIVALTLLITGTRRWRRRA